MGLCNSKPSASPSTSSPQSDPEPNKEISFPASNSAVPAKDSTKTTSSSANGESQNPTGEQNGKKSPFFPFYSPSPAHYLLSKKSPARSPANVRSNSTPRRFFRRPFPPPSPAKHIKAALARRHGSVKPNESSIPEGSEAERVTGLDKSFGFSKFMARL